jgi:cardiolipin synthase A/B
MALDEEINVVIIDDDVASELDRHFDEDLARSVRIEPGRWDDRSRVQRTYERIAGSLKRFF